MFVFFVLQRGYSRGPKTDLHAKYVKRRGPAQGCAFWGVLKIKKIICRPPFLRKTAILGPILVGLRKFSTENGLTMGTLTSKLLLVVIVAP